MKSFFIKTFILISISAAFIFGQSKINGLQIEEGNNFYKFIVEVPSFQTNIVSEEDENYVLFSVDGYGIKSEIGLPQLPQLTFNLIIDKHNLPKVLSFVEKSINERTLDAKVYPFQEPWPKNIPKEERKFTINRDYYLSDGNEKESLINISEPFIVRGVAAVRITLNPFRYNPSADKLTIVESFEIELQSSTSAAKNITCNRNYHELFSNAFVNYQGNARLDGNNYLIITDPQFEADLAAFAAHKTSRGYNVSIVNTNATGTTTTAIKSYIQNLYDNIATRPSYVLLVGDVGDIPGWTGDGEGSPNTDLHYALLDGTDYYADLSIGRFSVTNSTQLENIITKTIFMENNIGSLEKNNVFMASTDNSYITEGTHNYVIDNFFEPDGYDNLKLYTDTYNATTQQLIDALNDNKIFAIYSGHGGTTSWADGPPLSQSQVNDLTNTVFPFVYSFACITGQYEYAECFGETWIRTDNGGSAFYGSSVNSYWDEDDVLERKIFEVMFVDEITQITPMFDLGKIYLVNHFGSMTSTMIRYLEMYNLMGDPSLDTKKALPIINHTPLPNTEDLDGPYRVEAEITPTADPLDEDEIKLYYGRNSNPTNSVLMTKVSGDNGVYFADIPGNGSTATYNYYISAADIAGNYSYSPGGAPVQYHSFTAATDITNPVINHTPLEDIAYVYWAPDVTAEVTDNLGVSSVKTYFKVNEGSLESFDLVNEGGDIYSSEFPIDISELNIGDEISYYIEAEDLAINTNTSRLPSTGFFSFEIVDVAGFILVIDDTPSKGALVNDEKGTNIVGSDSKSATEIQTFLFSKNYAVDLETISTTNPTNWNDYDLIIISSGNNANPVDNLTFRQEVVNFVGEGGKLLIEGGETGYDYRDSKDQSFRDNVLNITGWISDNAGNLHINHSDHLISIEPNIINSILPLNPNYNYFDRDAVVCNENAECVFDWTNEVGDPGVIVVDKYESNNPYSHIIYFSFNLLALTSTDDWQCLLENSICYLMNDGIVPVELTNFTAFSLGKSIKLNWSTATETNNRGFEIERKSEKAWERIGFIEGSGTKLMPTNYQFIDNLSNVKTTNVSYRIKQIDLDGSFKYSDEIEVELVPLSFSLEQNYPNPFNPTTVIEYSIPVKGNVVLTVFNILGQKLLHQELKDVEPGYHKFEFDGTSFSSGIYIYSLMVNGVEGENNFSSAKKMMLIK
ncbi:MAG: C25 family cysteine peptidase [Melioribacteraceae bacterium]|nr:C25 family cysteine peptidase [Melioribacteraceae bacterium]